MRKCLRLRIRLAFLGRAGKGKGKGGSGATVNETTVAVAHWLGLHWEHASERRGARRLWIGDSV